MAAPKSPEHQALGAALRAARLSRNLTLEGLGARIAPEMNPRYISACERGEVNLSFGNLLRICDGLGVGVGQIICDYEAAMSRRPRAAGR